MSQSVTKCHKVTVGALEKLSGGGWWVVGGGGTVIITSAPGPGLCHSQRFFERFFGDSLRDSLEMDLVRSLTIYKVKYFLNTLIQFKRLKNLFEI